MRTHGNWKLSLMVPLLFALTCFVAQPAAAEEGDPPSRVGRISYLEGGVSFEPANTTDWTNATLNRPMTVGDRLWVDANSKAEIEAGDATLHLGDKTGVSFLNLDDKTIQVRMSEGALNMSVRELKDGDIYEVDTPNLAFTVTRAGAFRFDVNEAGDYTGITALGGEGEVTAEGQTYHVNAGERAEFRGQEHLDYQTSKAPRPDQLDQWATERDLRGDRSESAKYVSRDVTGYEDLDEYGNWREEPDYGPVWYPSAVEAGWAPYSYGSWAWVDPWGWSWVGYEPWGFAPFHYGRWGFIGGRWGWCPGPRYGRSFYAPALVGFVGGRGWGFGFGSGAAWFPLGFGEVYHPWFRASRGYLSNINIRNTRITNVNMIHTNVNGMHFANMRVPGAVTAVSRNTFVNGQPVHNTAFHPRANQLTSARVQSRIDAAPTMHSRLGAEARGNVRTPPSSVQNRPVVSRATPASSARMATRPAMSAAGARSQGASRAERPGAAAVANSAPLSRRATELQRARPSWASHSGAGNAATGTSPISRPNASFNRGADRPATRAMENSRPVPSPSNRTMNANRPDRPPQSYSNNRAAAQSPRSSSTNRPAYNYSGRSSSASPRSNSAPSRTYSPPSRSYSAPSRTYSEPSRSYSAPSRSSSPAPRSYSAPQRSSGGGHSSAGSSRGGGSSATGGGSSRSHR